MPPNNQAIDMESQSNQQGSSATWNMAKDDKVHGGNYAAMPQTPRSNDNTSQDSSPFVSSPTYSPYAVKSVHLRECMAEFLGTLIMILFGMGVNNQVGLSNDTKGTWLSINICWGIAVMLGVHASEGISGAHLNPSVTFANAVYGKLAWRKVPGYFLAQFLGAFVGAFFIYLLDYQTLNVVDPDRTTSQAHFSTYPSANISNVTAFYTEFLGTAMLVLGVYAITDKRNRPASSFGAPISFALLIMAIGMAFGMNTGYAINPARDFGPRLFTCLAGWGTKVFTLRSHYFWIPLVAPLLGGVAGGGLYKVFVEIHHPPLPVSETERVECMV
ncbi:Aquaporin, partial [Globisporangium splendens]